MERSFRISLVLFLNDPEEIQYISCYDGVAEKHRQPSRGKELIDRPKNERGRQKARFTRVRRPGLKRICRTAYAAPASANGRELSQA